MSNPPTIITVVLADGGEIGRTGLHNLLDHIPGIQVVDQVQGGHEGKQLVIRLRSQPPLLNLGMPNFSAQDFEKWVQENYPEMITLVLAEDDHDAYLAGVMESGATGYLDKSLSVGQLLSAIRRATHGGTFFPEGQVERSRREDTTAKWESLSKREREVLQKLAEGDDNKTIAAALGVTINTVEKHLSNIYRKLGMTSRAEAIHWWFEKITDFRN